MEILSNLVQVVGDGLVGAVSKEEPRIEGVALALIIDRHRNSISPSGLGGVLATHTDPDASSESRAFSSSHTIIEFSDRRSRSALALSHSSSLGGNRSLNPFLPI